MFFTLYRDCITCACFFLSTLSNRLTEQMHQVRVCRGHFYLHEAISATFDEGVKSCFLFSLFFSSHTLLSLLIVVFSLSFQAKISSLEPAVFMYARENSFSNAHSSHIFTAVQCDGFSFLTRAVTSIKFVACLSLEITVAEKW